MTEVVTLPGKQERPYLAQCSCGWQSKPWPEYTQAVSMKNAHSLECPEAEA